MHAVRSGAIRHCAVRLVSLFVASSLGNWNDCALAKRARQFCFSAQYFPVHLSRPGAQYQWRDGLAYKEFGDTLDLIAFDTVDQLAALPDERRINLLVPAEMDAFADFKSFDYPFGGLALARAFEPSKIVRQMAMSDVF